MRRAVIASFLLACAPPSRPPTRVVPPATDVVVTLGAGESAYAAPSIGPQPLNPLSAAFLGVVGQKLGHPVQVCPRLTRAAQLVAESVHGSAPPTSRFVLEVMAHHGLAEPTPFIFMWSTTEPNPTPQRVTQAFSEKVSVKAGRELGWMGVGSARHHDQSVYVLLLLGSPFAIEPMPRQLEVGQRVALRGRLDGAYRAPEVVVTPPVGAIRDVDTALRRGRVESSVSCSELPGRYQVEVLAEGPLGPTVVANFPVWCGVSPPSTIAFAPLSAEAIGSPADAARKVLELINESRRQVGLPPLAWHAPAAEVAVAHSEDMRRHDFVGHVSPSTGSPVDRARRGGVVTPLLLENVAKAYSATEAHLALMGSPAHRANILHEKVTHVGVGVVIDEAEPSPALYVTELFVREGQRLSADEARSRVARRVAQLRRSAGLAPLVASAELTRLAQVQAERFAAGERPRGLAPPPGFVRVITVAIATPDPHDLGRDGLAEPAATHLGIGVAQGTHPDLGDGAFFVFLVVAQGDRR